MKSTFTLGLLTAFALGHETFALELPEQTPPTDGDEVGRITVRSGGLHGYIGCSAERPLHAAGYGAGIGFYTAI
jgi:hypothetical protein